VTVARWATVSQGTAVTEIARKAKLDRRTVQRLLNGRSSPRRSHRQTLTGIAAELAASDLLDRGLESARAPLATLAIYRDAILTRPTLCAVCLTPLLNYRSRYCGEACKRRAYRAGRLSSRLSSTTDRPERKAYASLQGIPADESHTMRCRTTRIRVSGTSTVGL
jgi:hypothetical protein